MKIDWETLLMCLCAGAIAASPVAMNHGSASTVFWAGIAAAAAYIKGKYESKPASGMADKPSEVVVTNEASDPVPTTAVKP